MRYEEMCRALDEARQSAQRIKVLSLRVNETLQVNQRLTSLYGSERVKSSSTNESPVLRALIRREQELERYREELDCAVESQHAGERIINRLPPGQDRDMLTNYYLMGWGYEKLARLTKRTKRTVQRNLTNALQALFRAQKKEDGC